MTSTTHDGSEDDNYKQQTQIQHNDSIQMNCPENQQQKCNPHLTGEGGGGVLGSKIQKFGKFHELPRKSIYIFLTPGGVLEVKVSK